MVAIQWHMVVILACPPNRVVLSEVGKLARITTMHLCMATTRQILDMVGPYRVSGEHTMLYFIWFLADGLKIWDSTSFHLYGAWVRFVVGRGYLQIMCTTCENMSESW